MRVAIVSSKALQQDWNVERLISDAGTHIEAMCSCPICQKNRLVVDACRAEELFDLDELEQFAAERKKKE